MCGISRWCQCQSHTFLLALSHYWGFPQLFRWQRFTGFCSYQWHQHGASVQQWASWHKPPWQKKNQREPFCRSVIKVSRMCWSSCSVSAHLEGQQTLKSWVQTSRWQKKTLWCFKQYKLVANCTQARKSIVSRSFIIYWNKWKTKVK